MEKADTKLEEHEKLYNNLNLRYGFIKKGKNIIKKNKLTKIH